MNGETKSAKPRQRASLAAFLDRPEKADRPLIRHPRGAEVLPPGGRHHDRQPVLLLMVVGLFIALGLALSGYHVWQHAQAKNKPHSPPRNMPMVVVGEPK